MWLVVFVCVVLAGGEFGGFNAWCGMCLLGCCLVWCDMVVVWLVDLCLYALFSLVLLVVVAVCLPIGLCFLC